MAAGPHDELSVAGTRPGEALGDLERITADVEPAWTWQHGSLPGHAAGRDAGERPRHRAHVHGQRATDAADGTGAPLPPGPETLTGRERAWRLVDSLLARAQQGCGSTLLVEGRPGMGKTSLLSQAGREARARGFMLVTAAADRFRQAVPFAPLEAAIRGGARAGEERHRDAAGTWASEIGRLRASLAERTARHPILVSLDDLQWADQATLTALRTLPRALGRHRLLWILARSESSPGNRPELLFKLLEDDGAVRVTLAPLGGDAVTGMLTDGFGSAPDEGLLRLAAEAGGNPHLVSQLVQGLREEGAVRTEGGKARLVRARPPQRIQRIVRNQLGGLGRQTQQFLEIAAVLGGSLSLEDAAALIGVSPAAALAQFD
jgi:predicted ATPase